MPPKRASGGLSEVPEGEFHFETGFFSCFGFLFFLSFFCALFPLPMTKILSKGDRSGPFPERKQR